MAPISATLHQLRIFSEVATCGKINKAADTLYLSQSTVSQAISDLESYYNVKLFDRLSRRLHLTPTGAELLQYANRIFGLVDEMDHFLYQSANSGILRVGASVTAGTYIMNQITKRFQELMPQAHLQVCVYSTPQIRAKLLTNELDVALTEGDFDSDEMVTRPVIQDRLVLVCCAEHPFSQRTHVDKRELEDQEFVLRESTSGTRKLFDRFIRENHLNVKVSWICNNTEAVKLSVLDNRGMTLISESLVHQECQDGRLHIVEVDGVNFERDLSLVYHKDKQMTAALSQFCQLCQAFSEGSDDEGIKE